MRKNLRLCLFEYAKINDVSYLMIFNFYVYKRVGDVFSVLGVLVNMRDKSWEPL